MRITEQGAVFADNEASAKDDDEAALSILQMTIDESLASLPEHHRQILALRVEGHEIEEIAARTQRSKRTVERVLQEVRLKLSHLLHE